MLNLTPENGSQVSPKVQPVDNTYQQKAQLITPPSSVKQSTTTSSDKQHKAEIVNKYITEASIFILSFWKNPIQNSMVSSLFENSEMNQRGYERFTREVLKRSRCSLLGLQVAMYYLFKLQSRIKNRFVSNNKVLMCPKRTFLVCLILSFKFNYDSNYSFKSWSKISGLQVAEIKTLEFNILRELDYDLNCNADVFDKWSSLLSQAFEKIENLVEARKKFQSTTDDTLFSRKRHFSSTGLEDNNIKRFRVEIV